MRSWIAAYIVVAAFDARAEPARLLLVVRPAADEFTLDAQRLVAALTVALEAEPRFALLDVEPARGESVPRALREVEDARRDVASGIGALYELRTDEAGDLLRRGVNGLRRHPERLSFEDVRALADGLAHLAAIQLLEGNERRGKELIGEALAIVPDLEADKRVYNPPMRRAFAREKKRLAARVGSISASSTPEGGLVWVDGVPRGAAPLEIDDLSEGAHVVRISAEGHLAWGQLIYVVARASVNARADLAPLGDIARRIDQAFLAADSNANAPAAVAALGREVECDQVMLARARRVNDERLAVDVALYRVAYAARLARASRELELTRLEEEAQALVTELMGGTETGEVGTFEPSASPDDEPDVTRTRPPPPAEPVDWLGWGLTGGGAALAGGGVAMAIWGESVLADSSSLRADKRGAAAVGYVGLGMTAIGLALSTWGGWMLWDAD